MKIFNTMTRKKEEFIPITPNKVGIYVCGATVYNYFHIGNARPMVVFDTLRRYFEYKGYEVTYVQNFTDIDDKMIRRANEEGITVKELGDKYINEFFVDSTSLNVKKASVHPRATEHIDEIIALISGLVEKGIAYQAGNDVYYDVTKFSGYGKLCGQNLEDLDLGNRIDVDDIKRNPMDFALWKGKKEGEPYWESPWGEGRPGWHIECSAMSMKYLGESFDIHAGGQDLIFPHHENEIAQSEGCTGHVFAKYWMHNGFINVDNQKMSKSLGNFFTMREISEHYDSEVARLFLLSVQYRNPINFSDKIMEDNKNALERLYNSKRLLKDYIGDKTAEGDVSAQWAEKLNGFRATFEEKMDDDLNTADAISVMFDLVREINIAVAGNMPIADAKAAYGLLMELAGVLGILYKEDAEISEDDEITALIEERTQARKSKNWARADEIRDILKEKGIVLEDTPQGVRWKRA
ncbi:MAG: cysteine--tRNA ligase [Clostridiales bacterium]|nr:cysteine--tRNA ligase [Clostridiales bacterium]